MKAADILVVDDEPTVGRLLKDFLGGHGYHVRVAAGGREALACIEQARPDLVILDLLMPDCDGVEVLLEIRRHWPSEWPFGVIVLTGSRDVPLLETALALGAFDVLLKPVDLPQLELAVRAQLVMRPPRSSPEEFGSD